MSSLRALAHLYAVAVYAFLLAPVIVIVLSSVTTTQYVAFPPQGFTLQWYAAIAAHPEFVSSLVLSIAVAAGTAVAATVLGTLFAIGIVRERVPGHGVWLAVVSSPLIIPAVVLAIALLQWYSRVSLSAGPQALIIGHTILALPYVVRLVAAALTTLDPAIERASAGLGAAPVQTLLRITIPVAGSSIVAGALFAFITSFDDLTIALFVSSSTVVTLPVRIFDYMEYNYDPLITSASTVMVFLSVALIVVVERVIGVSRLFAVSDHPSTAAG